MDVRKCGQPAPDVIRRMEAQYVHTSIHPNFHTRTELASSYQMLHQERTEPSPNIGPKIKKPALAGLADFFG